MLAGPAALAALPATVAQLSADPFSSAAGPGAAGPGVSGGPAAGPPLPAAPVCAGEGAVAGGGCLELVGTIVAVGGAAGEAGAPDPPSPSLLLAATVEDPPSPSMSSLPSPGKARPPSVELESP